MTIWVGTDWHLVEYISRIKGELKNPKATQILTKYKEQVGPADLFIYLGDICYKLYDDLNELKDMLDGCLGYKVFVRGNHDMQNDAFYYEAGFDMVCDAAHLGNLLFTHKPVQLPEDSKLINIHGHMHTETFQTFDGKHVNPYGYCHGTLIELRRLLAAAKCKLLDPKEFTAANMPDEIVPLNTITGGYIYDLSELVLHGVDGHPIDETSSKKLLDTESEILNDIIFDFDDVKLVGKTGRPDGKDEDDITES